MKHGWLGLLGVGVVVGFAACGGNVVFDKPTGGAGGAGGAGDGGEGNIFDVGSSSTGMTTSFDVGSSSTGFPNTTTGTGPSTCDDLGVCSGAGREACVDCAVGDACLEVTNACFSTPECNEFNECLGGACGGVTFEECYKSCAAQFPEGEAMFSKVVVCIVCQECPVSCKDLGYDFLCP